MTYNVFGGTLNLALSIYPTTIAVLLLHIIVDSIVPRHHNLT